MTTSPPALFRLFALLALPFLLAGCLHFRQTITLHGNGSMTVSFLYSLHEDQVPAFAAAHEAISQWQQKEQAPPSRNINWFMDETTVRSYFNQPQQGLRVLLYKRYRQNNRIHTEIIVEAQNAQRACDNGYFGKLTLDKHQLAIQLDDISQTLLPADRNRLRTLCDDLTLEVEVVTPTNITNTNGYRRDKKRAYWLFSADGRGLDIFGKLSAPTVSW